jgi:hypothetical protein
MLLPDHHDLRSELIASTSRGHATRCPCCGALHLRFGNAVLNLDASDLEQLVSAVRSIHRKPRSRTGSVDDAFMELYFGNTGVGFAFDAREIAELEQLLIDVERRIALNTIPELIMHRSREIH